MSVRALCLLVGVSILAGCAVAGPVTPAQRVLRPAADAPDHFLVGEADGTTREPGGNDACESPMVDPRDGTRVTLVRSSDGLGDYAVDGGRYGVAEGEVLRIDCRTGKAIGVFARSRRK